MSSHYYWKPYISVAQRRRRGAREVTELRKSGREVSPVDIAGRKIATTFWGEAWCDNLESYSDFANRLPRGRTYVRNGSVIDLQLETGRVSALVSGSDIYDVGIAIKPLTKKRWADIKSQCAGRIGSLIELLRGSISTDVMRIVTRTNHGLFPAPREISLSCSCPDWATICKHVAATLYGVGARLDHAPDLLFTLRGVDATEMVNTAIDETPSGGSPRNGKMLDSEDLAAVFGIDLDLAKHTRRQQPSARKRNLPTSANQSRTIKLRPDRLEQLRARAELLVEQSAALHGLVHELQLARGRLYLWWEPEDLMARITPSNPGPLVLETPRGRSWTEVKRGQLATVLKALERTA